MNRIFFRNKSAPIESIHPNSWLGSGQVPIISWLKAIGTKVQAVTRKLYWHLVSNDAPNQTSFVVLLGLKVVGSHSYARASMRADAVICWAMKIGFKEPRKLLLRLSVHRNMRIPLQAVTWMQNCSSVWLDSIPLSWAAQLNDSSSIED